MLLRERREIVDPTSGRRAWVPDLNPAALHARLPLVLDRDDSPCYPSVRLFWQSERRNYDEVLARVRDELQAVAATFGR